MDLLLFLLKAIAPSLFANSSVSSIINYRKTSSAPRAFSGLTKVLSATFSTSAASAFPSTMMNGRASPKINSYSSAKILTTLRCESKLTIASVYPLAIVAKDSANARNRNRSSSLRQQEPTNRVVLLLGLWVRSLSAVSSLSS